MKVYGIYVENRVYYLVTEFVSGGSLEDFVQKNQGTITPNNMIQMAKDIASGMAALEQAKIIHRDLALRNVLVSQSENKFICRISDFGLSRKGQVYSQSEETRDELPWKWLAPEVLKTFEYSSKSDVIRRKKNAILSYSKF